MFKRHGIGDRHLDVFHHPRPGSPDFGLFFVVLYFVKRFCTFFSRLLVRMKDNLYVCPKLEFMDVQVTSSPVDGQPSVSASASATAPLLAAASIVFIGRSVLDC